jgi:hypothetical protein
MALCSHAIVGALVLLTTISAVRAEAAVGTLKGAAVNQNGWGRFAESNAFMHRR